nr:charged multivesicular body protein 3 [Hymenolepis microstoma]
MKAIFHNEKDLRPRVRKLQSELKREQRKLDREIVIIQQKCKQSELEVKRYAQRNNMDAAKVLAKEIAKSRMTINRLYQAKAQIGSVCAELDNQISMAKMANALKQSTTVMQSMSNLVKLPELQTTMKNLSKEMMKLGIINEVVDDSIDSALGGGEDLEEKAQAEVDKILFELTNGAMGQAPDAVTDTLPAGIQLPSAGMAEEVEETADDLEEMRARLEAIR